MNSLMIKKAREYFYQKKFSLAYDIFCEMPEYQYEAGLCVLLEKNIKEAKKIWKKMQKIVLRANLG